VSIDYQSLSVPVGFSLETRNRAAVVAWSPVVIAAAAAVAWSLAMMLVARAPDAPPVALKADRDALLAPNGDFLSRVNALPLAPAAKVDGGLPNEDLPSIDGQSTPPPDPPSSPASKPVRAEATPHHHARVRHHRDVCAAHGMRRKDFYQHNHWRSWRCVG
jgi:hypothetical protein